MLARSSSGRQTTVSRAWKRIVAGRASAARSRPGFFPYQNPVTPASYRVTGIPTLNVYQNGEVVKSIVGAKPKAALLSDLADYLA